MDEQEILYALAKQVDTIDTVTTDYGPIDLDDEARAVVIQALKSHFNQRLQNHASDQEPG